MNKYIGMLEILCNEKIANDTYKMILQGESVRLNRNPGQFVNIKVSDKFFLKRPISISDINNDELTIVYKILGEGTRELSNTRVGDKLEVLNDLGNGFDTTKVKGGEVALLIGGGVGIPPLYLLAKKLIEKNVKVEVVLGANSDQDLFYIDEFKAISANVMVATVTGSIGTKGFVTDAIIENDIKFDYYYACGPTAMLKSLHKMFPTSGQLSFEERMACGFGACMGCVCKNKHYPYKRVCIDGPVFDVEEVLFDE